MNFTRMRFFNVLSMEKLHELSTTKPQMLWKKIRKVQGKHKTNELKLSVDAFYEHFKNLFSEKDLYTNADAENHLNDEALLDRNRVDELDQNLTVNEINIAI